MSTVGKLTLVQKILSILKLDDKGKIQSFIDSETKTLKNFVRQLESNEKQEDLRFELRLTTLEEKLEDAVQEVEEAYLQIPLDRIQSNQDKKDFSKVYWDNIKNKENKLKRLQEERKEIDEQMKDYKKEQKEQKDAYASRISKINS